MSKRRQRTLKALLRPVHLAVAAGALLTLFRPTAAQERPAAPEARVVRLDPRFDALVPKDAVLETVVDGLRWVEGPVWDRREGQLFFSDVVAGALYRWKPGNGLAVVLKPSGYSGARPFGGREPGSNGLALDAEGRLVLCQHGDRRIVRREHDGHLTVLADRYEGKRLNSPNDLVYTSRGELYFTDPPFGLPQAFDDPAKELPWQGVYRLSRDGRLSLVIKDVRAPNGIAFSPDERTLYVSNADRARPVWLAYDVDEDGAVGSGRVLFDGSGLLAKGPGVPDGMKVDAKGNLFVAAPGGIHVITPRGEHIGSIETGVATANCAFGEDGSRLYVAADTTLRRIRLATKGKRF